MNSEKQFKSFLLNLKLKSMVKIFDKNQICIKQWLIYE